MNNKRRKRIVEAKFNISMAKGYIEQANNIIEEVRSEEEESHDNLPESLMDSERAYTMEENNRKT